VIAKKPNIIQGFISLQDQGEHIFMQFSFAKGKECLKVEYSKGRHPEQAGCGAASSTFHKHHHFLRGKSHTNGSV
jgi:hypothetical protein